MGCVGLFGCIVGCVWLLVWFWQLIVAGICGWSVCQRWLACLCLVGYISGCLEWESPRAAVCGWMILEIDWNLLAIVVSHMLIGLGGEREFGLIEICCRQMYEGERVGRCLQVSIPCRNHGNSGGDTGVYISVQGLHEVVCHYVPSGNQERYLLIPAVYF